MTRAVGIRLGFPIKQTLIEHLIMVSAVSLPTTPITLLNSLTFSVSLFLSFSLSPGLSPFQSAPNLKTRNYFKTNLEMRISCWLTALSTLWMLIAVMTLINIYSLGNFQIQIPTIASKWLYRNGADAVYLHDNGQ